ncbi:hypothetical protein PTSG_06517 [Salpingoeca rosetta]|uniref:Metallo-beta-lactamase domain-containing protein n=1 Tax=Salpingoeca rosetta (strain ATCC 50818 / BSB-021) TaxID=946362 RepID=F2UG14_SALR5|nr:uncharacterized protein PTSG_06517 [Salpingoeca rosetta]EGD75442.1 hypothetical protein PTSG_06517 [Salpingoeca rosetta]|eukprot:XP_004991899.1 hypothetical protein PTSG_06517 [Salpingoeca rosetta]
MCKHAHTCANMCTHVKQGSMSSPKKGPSRLVLLGTGASSSVPNLACLIRTEGPECTVCQEAARNPLSRNLRGNPSMLIQYQPSLTSNLDLVRVGNADDDGVKNILFDAGKTFASAVARFFPKLGVTGIDALVISHDHADAVLGIDDLRSVHYLTPYEDEKAGRTKYEVAKPIEAFCSDETFERMQGSVNVCLPSTSAVFPYLIPKKQIEAINAGEPKRFVSRINWHVVANLSDRDIDVDPPFSVFGLELQPVRMMHGGSYICLGFLFGPKDARIAYLSDVKVFPKPTMDLLLEANIDLMIIDSLYISEEHDTHMCLTEVVQVVRRVKPKRTVLVGMTHDFDYNTFDQALCSVVDDGEDLNIHMGYDGISFDVEL